MIVKYKFNLFYYFIYI